jgi:YD repeat-containing protein
MSWESIPFWPKLEISATTGQVTGRQLPNSSTYTAKYTYYTGAADHRAGRLATSSTWTYPSNAALGTTTYNYNERGQVVSITGNGTTPSAYTYDAAGRTTTLTTWRGAAGDPATAQVTTWTYSTHPTLPLVRSKKYPGRPIGIDYSYAADGSLAARDWERPDGSNRLRTTYSTNSFGQTTGVTYSNAAVTPPVAFAYDRAGRVRYRTDAAGTTLLEYRYDGTLLTETTVTAPNNDTPLAAGRHLRRTVDAFGRLTG